jgi:hypothetical protein
MEFILGGCLLLTIITNLIQLVYNNRLIDKNKELKSNVDKLESKKKENDKLALEAELVNLIGCRATLPQSLTYNDKDSFSVVYEVEIVDISKDKAKIKVLDFSSTDKIANESAKRSGIINFMNNKWVNRRDMSIIIDTATIRNNKLKQLGID